MHCAVCDACAGVCRGAFYCGACAGASYASSHYALFAGAAAASAAPAPAADVAVEAAANGTGGVFLLVYTKRGAHGHLPSAEDAHCAHRLRGAHDVHRSLGACGACGGGVKPLRV